MFVTKFEGSHIWYCLFSLWWAFLHKEVKRPCLWPFFTCSRILPNGHRYWFWQIYRFSWAGPLSSFGEWLLFWSIWFSFRFAFVMKRHFADSWIMQSITSPKGSSVLLKEYIWCRMRCFLRYFKNGLLLIFNKGIKWCSWVKLELVWADSVFLLKIYPIINRETALENRSKSHAYNQVNTNPKKPHI